MSRETSTPGLTADWLNAWLAAVGITVLVPESSLSWTADGVPKAKWVLDRDDRLAEAVATALPGLDRLDDLAIAGLPRNVPLERYRVHAALARQNHDPSLVVSLTDLVRADDGQAEHSPLDPPAPRGETLFSRLRRCREALPDDGLIDAVEDTLRGRGRRIAANGLGFDYRRLQAAAVEEEKSVDPVIECLAFFGMWCFPIRGAGDRARVRGWTMAPSRPGAFTWPVWSESLDRWGIDALLDRWYRDGRRCAVYGAFGAYESVAYQAQGSSDVTRAYAARRAW